MSLLADNALTLYNLPYPERKSHESIPFAANQFDFRCYYENGIEGYKSINAMPFQNPGQSSIRNFGIAWVALTLSLAIHVLDESTNDFLSSYNPFVEKLNITIGVSLFPTFSFSVWLVGLIVAILVLLLLSVYAFRNKKWIRRFSYFYSILMILNGCGHITASIIYNTPVPGLYSSPLLIISSIFALSSALALKTRQKSIKHSSPS